MGSFGFAYSSAERIAHDLQAVRQSEHHASADSKAKPLLGQACGLLHANFFIFPPRIAPTREQAEAAIGALAKALGDCEPALSDLHHIDTSSPALPELEAQLEAVWPHRPALLSFHLGLPPAQVISKAQGLGICVAVTATRLEEAQAIEASGADVVIAQGIEAGGHRGCFDPEAEDPGHSTADLVRILADRCRLPIVAAGGIMDREDIATMLAAGASAVQLGTAFLSCEESGASPEHKRFLLHEHQRDTVITRSFSGRPARGLHNRFIARMDEGAALPFPLQHQLSAGLRRSAVERGDGEYQSLWAGTGYRRCRSESVASLIDRLAPGFT